MWNHHTRMQGVLHFSVSARSKKKHPPPRLLRLSPDGTAPVAQQRLKVRRSIRGNEMRWTFVCLTGNIQPVSFSVSETAASASEHYCQANVWWKHTDFPFSCQPHGSFSQTVCSALGAGPLNLRRVGGAAQLSQIRESGLFFTRSVFFPDWLACAGNF